MAKGNAWSADVLKLLFQAQNVANIADNTATSPLTVLYVSLHTANPGAGGAQNTSEAAYGSYARVSVARTTGGWTLTGQTITPVANISFPQASSGSETETFFGIGTAVSGAGILLYSGTITPNIVVTTGVTPILASSSTVIES